MKLVLALVGCVAILAGLAYALAAPVVPVTAVSEGATACPNDVCIINYAEWGGAAYSPQGEMDKFCFAMDQNECNACCEQFGNDPGCGHIVGEAWCYCTQGARMRQCA